MFHSISGITAAEKRADNVREFIGDGTPFLRVPGLKKVLGVRIGQMSLPLETTIKYPVDPQHTDMKTEKVALVQRDVLPDGTPVLLRNQMSNDGMWQQGQPIYVTGDWEPAE